MTSLRSCHQAFFRALHRGVVRLRLKNPSRYEFKRCHGSAGPTGPEAEGRWHYRKYESFRYTVLCGIVTPSSHPSVPEINNCSNETSGASERMWALVGAKGRTF